MKLLLFDIDGTLLLSGGAGMRALNQAIGERWGECAATVQVRPDGKTDPEIVREIGQRCGYVHKSEDLAAIFERYVDLLERELESQSLPFAVLPGVETLVAKLAREPALILGVATGNIEQGARLKLRRASLESYFRFGGYGSDSENRSDVIRTAIERACQGLGVSSLESVTVIGDTPRDIVHGREVGAQTIAVATGSYTTKQLERHGPDLVLSDLQESESIFEMIGVAG